MLPIGSIDSVGRYLDVGCGTGSLTKALRARAPDAVVVGLDPARDYIARLHAQNADERTWFCMGDAQRMPFAGASFDAAFALLILQQMPDPNRAVAEMREATRPGGTIGTAMWDFKAGMPMFSIFWDAVAAVDPDAAAKRNAGKRRPIDHISERSLADLWQASGLTDIETTTVEVVQNFADLEDFWRRSSVAPRRPRLLPPVCRPKSRTRSSPR